MKETIVWKFINESSNGSDGTLLPSIGPGAIPTAFAQR